MSVTPRIGAVYVCDVHYHLLTLVSMASVARAHAQSLDFRLVQIGYDRGVPARFADFIRAQGHRLEVVSRAPDDPAVARWLLPVTRKITNTAYLKALAIDSMAARYDYVLYLDSDVLAFADPMVHRRAGFAETCAAGLDISTAAGLDNPRFFESCAEHGASTRYFNTGVMLINAARWRDRHCLERFDHFHGVHAEGCFYFNDCDHLDQCTFNLMFQDDLHLLPLSLNVQQCAMHTRLWRDATVRHYTGARKFMPLRRRNADRRQYRLLCAIEQEAGLAPRGPKRYDGGLSYGVNAVRRACAVIRFERAIEMLRQRHGTTVAGG